MQASDGKPYGMNSAGGMLGGGVIFQYDRTSNTNIENYNFVGSDDTGRNPEYTNLIEIVAASTGANEKATKTSFSIYPNPFTFQSSIVFSEEQKNTSIKMMDVLGKEIKTITLNGTRTYTLEKNERQAGIYFIQVIDDKKNVVTKKIVIQ